LGSHGSIFRFWHLYLNSIRAWDIVLPAAGSYVTFTLLFVSTTNRIVLV
jgi:hypothetical protein